MDDAPNTIPESVYVYGVRRTDPRPAPDDDSTPMSRTELAMLWDLLGRWIASHQAGGTERTAAEPLRAGIDWELAERFGG